MRIVLPRGSTGLLGRRSTLLSFVVVVVLGSIGSVWGQQTSSVTIAWDPSLDPDITTYRVYFGLPGSEALALLMEVPSLESSVEVTNLVPNVTYCAEITAVRGSCESARSAVVCATPTNTGPTIIPLTPPGGDQCASRSDPLTIQLDDVDDAINQSSIVVLVNGTPVTPSISGTAGSLTLTVPIPASPPANGNLNIQVTAEDQATPANTSTLSYSVRLQPPAPTGVSVF